MNPQTIFDKGLEQHHYANTAYPLDGNKVWKDYRVPRKMIDQIVEEQWKEVDELGLYVHIPFCERRCNYCEYAVLSGDEANQREEYFNSLIEEIGMYNNLTEGKRAIGLDIGGGTPTILSPDKIGKIIDIVSNNYILAEDFNISIETTPKEATDLDKLKSIDTSIVFIEFLDSLSDIFTLMLLILINPIQ